MRKACLKKDQCLARSVNGVHWRWWGRKTRKEYTEWLKKSRNEGKSTYSAKYQVPTTLEHVVLIIPLATAQLQNQKTNVPTHGRGNAVHNLRWSSNLKSRRIAKDNSRKISITKSRLKSTLQVGDRAGMNGLRMRIRVTNVSVDDVVWRWWRWWMSRLAVTSDSSSKKNKRWLERV